MRTCGIALERKGEDAEHSPDDDRATQSPILDFDVAAHGLESAQPPLEFQHGEFGK